MNENTPDGAFGLRLVQCDGTCHLAPLLRLEGKYLGLLSVSDAIKLARGIRGEEPAAPDDAGGTAEAPAQKAEAEATLGDASGLAEGEGM